MKFSDLLGDEQPDGEAPPAPDPPAPDLPAPDPPRSTAEPIGVLDRSSHLAAVNVTPEVAVPTATPEETNHVEVFETFDDDLLPSARSRRNRR